MTARPSRPEFLRFDPGDYVRLPDVLVGEDTVTSAEMKRLYLGQEEAVLAEECEAWIAYLNSCGARRRGSGAS
jgi:hypothetical protein